MSRSWIIERKALSGFQTSWLPQFTVPQKDKYRIISDAKQTGLNSCIDLPSFGTLKMDSIPLLLSDIQNYSVTADLYIITADCASYFRQFPLALPDRLFTLLCHDADTFIVDGRLPFGVCSAPIITHQFLDLFCWVVSKKFGIPLRHYSDNCFCVVSGRDLALQSQKVLHLYYAYLGITINPRDSQCSRKASVLGFEIDATSRYASIPAEKKSLLLSLISTVLSNPTAKLLQTLVSRLIWYSCIIPGGMAHAVSLWNILDSGTTIQGSISLTPDALLSLKWFQNLLIQWDSVYYFDLRQHISAAGGIPDLSTASDSSPLGAGVVTTTHFSAWTWCPCCWISTQDISSFELAALLLTLSTFLGSLSTRKIVAWHTDSQAAVDILKRGYSLNPACNDLLQEVFLAMSVFHCIIVPIWTPRQLLPLVDSLSRGNLQPLPPLSDNRRFLIPQGCTSLRQIGPDFIFGFSRNHPVSSC